MKGNRRDFFYFSRADRRVILVLVGILTGVALTSAFFLWMDAGKDGAEAMVADGSSEVWTHVHRDGTQVSLAEQPVSHEAVAQPETFPFDPNTADSVTLRRLGLRPWQVRNIYKYRARGGRYHRPSDFSRVYGLTKGDYDRLRPCIRIADEFKLMADLPAVAEERRDTFPRQEKLAEGMRLELNAADTAELKKIPGVGSVYARKIAGYRERLGGFVSVKQLSEVEGLPEDVTRWCTVEPDVFRTLALNRMSVEQLRRHPYLNFYQARVIVEHRRKNGALKNLQALSLYEEFTPVDLERLAPYVSFEE